MKILLFRCLLISSVIMFSTTNCGSPSSMLATGSKLITSLTKNPLLTEFAKLLQTPGLDKLLDDVLKKPFTMLAPTNEALKSLGTDALASLMKPEGLNSLANMVKNHLVPGKKSASDLQAGGVKTSAGKTLNLAGITLGTPIQDQDFNVIPVDKMIQ